MVNSPLSNFPSGASRYLKARLSSGTRGWPLCCKAYKGFLTSSRDYCPTFITLVTRTASLLHTGVRTSEKDEDRSGRRRRMITMTDALSRIRISGEVARQPAATFKMVLVPAFQVLLAALRSRSAPTAIEA